MYTQVTSPTEALIWKGYGVFHTGDLEAFLGMLDENVEWHIGDRHHVSGDYHGSDEVHEFLATLFDLTRGSFSIDTHEVMGRNGRAVALGTMRATRNGKALEQKIVHVFDVRDGEAVTQFWHVPFDRYLHDGFWS
jgi:ketosteroid isomerase-like protein